MSASHSDLILLFDAMRRLHGRLSGAFAPVRAASDLSEMEHTVLAAVAGAIRPPTVAQIGRSLGHPRQVIQRAANRLAAIGLIAFGENPDHKRASLLLATPRGLALQAEANQRAEAIAGSLLRSLDPHQVREARRLLESIRSAIDRHGKDTGA